MVWVTWALLGVPRYIIFTIPLMKKRSGKWPCHNSSQQSNFSYLRLLSKEKIQKVSDGWDSNLKISCVWSDHSINCTYRRHSKPSNTYEWSSLILVLSQQTKDKEKKTKSNVVSYPYVERLTDVGHVVE